MMKLSYIENNTDIRDVCRMCNKNNQFIIFSGLNRNKKNIYSPGKKNCRGENKMKKTESFKFHFHLVLLIGMKIVLFFV